MASTAFTSTPNLAKAAVKAIRNWQGIPADLDDDAVLAQELISPELLELVMQIITSLITDCLDNNKVLAWRRVSTHVAAKPLERLANNMRMNGVINKWLFQLGVARDRGDVVALRESLVAAASEANEKQLADIQTEVFSWTAI
jgi:hypothetical protein